MVALTYYGHSCIGLIVNDKDMLIDPFISQNPLASYVDARYIRANHILLTHGHYDHVADAEYIGNNTGATIVANHEVVNWYKKQNYPTDRLVPMNLGGTFDLGYATVKMVTAAHSSSMPDDSYGGLAGGFMVKAEGMTIYHAGDTALMPEFEMFAKYDKPDLAILPIGGHFTMDYEQAAEAARILGVRRAVGVHYDTFPQIQIDHDQAIRAFNDVGVQLILLYVGESFQL